MKVRTIVGSVVAVVGLVAVVAVGGLVVGGAPHQGGTKLSVAKPPPPSRGCTVRWVQALGQWVCIGAKPPPPPPPAVGCALTTGFWVCEGAAEKTGTSTSSSVVPTESPGPTAAVEVANGLGAEPPFPPFPHPFLIGPSKPQLAGQPAPQERPVLLMQLSAGLATAPAAPTATALLSDWPAAGKGTVTISLYSGSNVDACASPPLVTKTAGAGWGGVPYEWSATFSGLVVGSYEVQAVFAGKAGPMSTPCGRSALKVVPAPRTGQ